MTFPPCGCCLGSLRSVGALTTGLHEVVFLNGSGCVYDILEIEYPTMTAWVKWIVDNGGGGPAWVNLLTIAEIRSIPPWEASERNIPCS